MYDIIGDIHGHADELIELLQLLGYRQTSGIYQHDSRRVVFLGDFIDRGPQIAEVLNIVRPMVKSGTALTVMGNHEFNALAFHTPDRQHPPGHLRPHTEKNVKQHQATLDQLQPAELEDHLRWFRTFPLWLDLDEIRVVHACWDDKLLRLIDTAMNGGQVIDDAFLTEASVRDEPLFHAVDAVLKGKEAELPDGMTFLDKEGHLRTAIRTKWYLAPTGQTYRSYALQSDPIDCDLRLVETVAKMARPYSPDDKPVFVGHYWLVADRPNVLADNVACVDYSVAKGGMLCAYRWDGERKLDNANYVTVKAR